MPDLTSAAQYVYDRMAQDETDVDTLATLLFEQNVAIAEDEQQRLSGDAQLDAEILTAIREAAQESAESIVQTYNDDLILFLLAQPIDAPQASLLRLARSWRTDRAVWKQKQIAMQEQVNTRRFVMALYVKVNKLERRNVQWIPRTAREGYCQGWINRGVMPYAEAIKGLAGTHFGCVHTLQFVD